MNKRLTVGVCLLLGACVHPNANGGATSPSASVTGACAGIERESRQDLVVRNTAMLYDLGHLEGRVSEEQCATELRFRVQPGPVYRLGSYELTVREQGRERTANAEERAMIERLATLRVGDVFARNRMSEWMSSVTRVLRDQGYASAQVSPDVALDRTTHQVRLRLVLDRGVLVTVDEVRVLGVDDRERSSAQPELLLAAGQPFHEGRMLATKERLRSLFSGRSVDVSTEAITARNDRLRVTYEVR